MFKLIILICYFIGLVYCGCKSGSGGGGQNCGTTVTNRRLKGHSTRSSDYRDYDYDVIPLPDEVGTVGILDSPYYDCNTKSLYFVDLFKENIYRYSEESNQIYYCSIPGYSTLSFFIPIQGKKDKFVTGTNQTIYEAQWDGRSRSCSIVRTISTADEGATHHTNHAIAGLNGELFFGFFSSDLCSGPARQGLYRRSKNAQLDRLPGKYKTCNSMAFDYEQGIFYVMDGCTHVIRGFRVDEETGAISDPWIVFDSFGLPRNVATLGLSLDKNRILAVGTYKGGLMHFIDSATGTLLKRVVMPTRFMSANAYGGCDFKKLFVLTAEYDADLSNGEQLNTTIGPPAGSLLVFYGMGQGIGQLKEPCIEC